MRSTPILFIIFYSCNAITTSESRFIPGTYVRQSQTEFGKIYDTLVVSSQNANAGQYLIDKRWRYNRMVDGQPDPEYRQEKTAGIYDAKTKLMQDLHTGSYYSFDPDKSLLFNGADQYRKIK